MKNISRISPKTIICVAICLSVCFIGYSQSTFINDGIKYKIIKECDEQATFGTVVVTSLDNGLYEGDICIPNATKQTIGEYYDNYKVIGIDEYAFKGCQSLKRVTLPISIEYIGKNAFEGCKNLSTIEIPIGSLLSSLGECVFMDSGIESIILRGQMQEIPRMTFMNCKKLIEVSLPETVQTIGVSAFMYCSSLSQLNLPKGIINIMTCAFAYSGLTQICIPAKVTTISSSVFQMCKSLSKVELSAVTTKIEDGAFMGDTSLSEINRPSSLASVEQSAFFGCFNAPDSYISLDERDKYRQLSESGAFNY